MTPTHAPMRRDHRRAPKEESFVEGHGFSRAEEATNATQAQLEALCGRERSRVPDTRDSCVAGWRSGSPQPKS